MFFARNSRVTSSRSAYDLRFAPFSVVWCESTTVSIATGRPSSYTTESWLFESGRRKGISPDLRRAAKWRRSSCEYTSAVGMKLFVSRVA